MHLVTGKHQPRRNRNQPRSLLGCCILLQSTIPKLNKHECINDAPLLQDAPRAHTPSLSLSRFLSLSLSLASYLSIYPVNVIITIINIARTGRKTPRSCTQKRRRCEKAPKTRSATQTTRCCSAGRCNKRAPSAQRLLREQISVVCWKFWRKCALMTRKRPTD